MIKTENNLEEDLLTKADELETLANELENIYDTYGHTVGDIQKSGMEGKVDSLKWEGTKIYAETIPIAHKVYSSWLLPKQIRGSRQLRTEMGKAEVWSYNQAGVVDKVEEIEKGKYSPLFKDIPKHAGHFRTLAYGLRELVRENRNPDTTDPYWERIKNATIIEPRPGYAIRCVMSKEDGRGEFNEFYSGPQLLNSQGERELKRKIKELIGKKVIFFPIQTGEDSAAYGRAQLGQPEMNLEFDVREYDKEKKDYSGRVIRRMKAEEYNPFTRANAREVMGFLEKHVLKDKK